MMLCVLALAALLALGDATMYDVLAPQLKPAGTDGATSCAECAEWSAYTTESDARTGGPLWVGHAPPAGAGASCAQPARAVGGSWPGNSSGACTLPRPVTAWCFC